MPMVISRLPVYTAIKQSINKRIIICSPNTETVINPVTGNFDNYAIDQ